jgi:hypothetical protein
MRLVVLESPPPPLVKIMCSRKLQEPHADMRDDYILVRYVYVFSEELKRLSLSLEMNCLEWVVVIRDMTWHN